MVIRQISQETATEIIEKRKPLGLFYFKDNKTRLYIGIDNSTADAWTEEFQTLEECINWLNGEEVIKVIEKPMKARVIELVEVISQDPEGATYFMVGRKTRGKMVSDIIQDKENNTFWIFDENEEIMAEIRNCPVMIHYKDAENEE